jgi:hypothetical protein
MIDLDLVELENFSKMFEYEKLARDIDSIENIEEAKHIAKAFVKLYFKQQEIVSKFT